MGTTSLGRPSAPSSLWTRTSRSFGPRSPPITMAKSRSDALHSSGRGWCTSFSRGRPSIGLTPFHLLKSSFKPSFKSSFVFLPRTCTQVRAPLSPVSLLFAKRIFKRGGFLRKGRARELLRSRRSAVFSLLPAEPGLQCSITVGQHCCTLDSGAKLGASNVRGPPALLVSGPQPRRVK
ncbi:unnamed protein product [Scytosiphon promiscuus]